MFFVGRRMVGFHDGLPGSAARKLGEGEASANDRKRSQRMAQPQEMHVTPGAIFLHRHDRVIQRTRQRFRYHFAFRRKDIARDGEAEIGCRRKGAQAVLAEEWFIEMLQEVIEGGFERDRRGRIGGVAAVPIGNQVQHLAGRRAQSAFHIVAHCGFGE